MKDKISCIRLSFLKCTLKIYITANYAFKTINFESRNINCIFYYIYLKMTYLDTIKYRAHYYIKYNEAWYRDFCRYLCKTNRKIYEKPVTLLTVTCRLQQFLQSRLLPPLTYFLKHMNIQADIHSWKEDI